jgi:phage tail-like protein
MNYYPPVGFYFRVEIPDFAGKGDADSNFQEVSGLTAEIEVEKYQEGGENGFQHNLPKPAKFPNLVLKRGLLTDSKMITWLKDAIENFKFAPKNVTVTLMNQKGEPLVAWEFIGAYPIKWDISAFNSMDNSIVSETIELVFKSSKRSTDAKPSQKRN